MRVRRVMRRKEGWRKGEGRRSGMYNNIRRYMLVSTDMISVSALQVVMLRPRRIRLMSQVIMLRLLRLRLIR
jgi:hypothetical protein